MHVPKEKRKKLGYSATPSMLGRYCLLTKQYFIYDQLAKTHQCSRDIILREGKRYTAPDAADEAILNEHFYRDVIDEPKPKPTKMESETTWPNGDGNTERQLEEPLEDKSPQKPKKMSQEWAGLEMSIGEA